MIVQLDNLATEQLIVAAGATDTTLRDTVDDLGSSQVADLLIDEIAFRAEIPVTDQPVQVQLDVLDRDRRYCYTFNAETGKMFTVAKSANPDAAQLIEYQLVDLCRELFGPSRRYSAAQRRVEARFKPANTPALWKAVVASHQATTALLAGIDNREIDLNALPARYYSDKWGGLHWFTSHYEKHLRHLRDEHVRILEIGIGGYAMPSVGGGSLKMWRRYFPRGVVYGMDIFDKSAFTQPRVTTLLGNQSDPDYLASVVEKYGPFDVIIDDGSHINGHVRTSFDALFSTVRPGGVYVIEDLWTTYCPGYGGDVSTKAAPTTSIGLIKMLVDAINYEEHPDGGKSMGGVGSQITGVHAYHNIAFLDKGKNSEGSIPDWVPKHPVNDFRPA